MTLIHTTPHGRPRRPPTSSSPTRGAGLPAIQTHWNNARELFIPFMDYDVEIRTVLCDTNAIESLNARFRRS